MADTHNIRAYPTASERILAEERAARSAARVDLTVVSKGRKAAITEHDNDRFLAMREDVRAIFYDVHKELEAAGRSFPKFNSPHEGWAVVREEVDELWEYVKANVAETHYGYEEAVQIAAMAIRFAMDCCEVEHGR